MNNNTIIGILIVILVLGGGYWLWSSTGNGGFMATSTPSTTDTGTGDNGSGGTGDTTPPASNASAPSVVTDSKATPSNSTAVLTGRVTPNGAPTSYWYEYGESASLGSRTASQTIGSGYTAIASPGYITGLRANTQYNFRLSAQNAYGTVNGTMYAFSTNSTPPPTGNAPQISTNAGTDVQRTTATLNAHVNPRNAATTFWFEYGTDTNFGAVTAFQSAGSGSTSLAESASVSGLNPLTKYYFRVNAQNQFGTVNGATQSFTTQGPAAAGKPSADTTAATKIATSTVTLNGRVTPNGAQTSYWFEYSKDSLLGSILGTATAAQDVSANASSLAVSLDVKGLDRSTKYFYRLVARNQFGTVRGDIVNFSTKNN